MSQGVLKQAQQVVKGQGSAKAVNNGQVQVVRGTRCENGSQPSLCPALPMCLLSMSHQWQSWVACQIKVKAAAAAFFTQIISHPLRTSGWGAHL